MVKILERFKNAWNAFSNRDPTYYSNHSFGDTYSPHRNRLKPGNEKSIVNSIVNRISIDCAAVDVKHVRLNKNGDYSETINSGLNNCLTLEANKDQTGRAFVQDIVMSMLDEGVVAVVPVDTDDDPIYNNSFDILTLRTGKIVRWHPDTVVVNLYNDQTGYKKDIELPKSMVGIIENPMYSIMNEQNSILQRLIRKLNMLDAIDEQSSSGKLDLIIQLPYLVKTETRRRQAEARRKELEKQLAGSKYGIAYTDGTEKVTQLNRSVDNQLMNQIEYLTNMFYSHLGITTTILDGTADEATMLNYTNRTIEPIMSAIVNEFKRKFLTKTARSQRQSISFFRDPFKLVPVSQIAEIADKFTRNEIMSSNEIRQKVGLAPVNDEKADELRNKNLNVMEGQEFANTNETEEGKEVLEEKKSKSTEK